MFLFFKNDTKFDISNAVKKYSIMNITYHIK